MLPFMVGSSFGSPAPIVFALRAHYKHTNMAIILTQLTLLNLTDQGSLQSPDIATVTLSLYTE